MSARGLDRLTGNYRTGYRERPRAGALIINLSANPRLELGGVAMPHPTIDLACMTYGYYVTGRMTLVRALQEMIADEPECREVCLIGASKAGFGALHLSRSLARRDPGRRYSVIAFNPMTLVWPENRALTYPSYRKMIAHAADKPALRRSLEQVGNQREPQVLRNLRWLVFHPALNRRDTREAVAINGRNVTISPIEMRFHGTMLPFLCDTADEMSVRRLVVTTLRNAEKLDDLAHDTLTEEEASLVRDLRRVMPRPPLPRLIEWYTGIPATVPEIAPAAVPPLGTRLARALRLSLARARPNG